MKLYRPTACVVFVVSGYLLFLYGSVQAITKEEWYWLRKQGPRYTIPEEERGSNVVDYGRSVKRVALGSGSRGPAIVQTRVLRSNSTHRPAPSPLPLTDRRWKRQRGRTSSEPLGHNGHTRNTLPEFEEEPPPVVDHGPTGEIFDDWPRFDDIFDGSPGGSPRTKKKNPGAGRKRPKRDFVRAIYYEVDVRSPGFDARRPGLSAADLRLLGRQSPRKIRIPVWENGTDSIGPYDVRSCLLCPHQMIAMKTKSSVEFPFPVIPVCAGLARHRGRLNLAVTSGPRPGTPLVEGDYNVTLIAWKKSTQVSTCQFTVSVKAPMIPSKGREATPVHPDGSSIRPETAGRSNWMAAFVEARVLRNNSSQPVRPRVEIVVRSPNASSPPSLGHRSRLVPPYVSASSVVMDYDEDTRKYFPGFREAARRPDPRLPNRTEQRDKKRRKRPRPSVRAVLLLDPVDVQSHPPDLTQLRFPGKYPATGPRIITLHSPTKVYIPVWQNGTDSTDEYDEKTCVRCPLYMTLMPSQGKESALLPVPAISICSGLARRRGRLNLAVTSGPRPGTPLVEGDYNITLIAWKKGTHVSSCQFTVSVKVRRCPELKVPAGVFKDCTLGDVWGSTCKFSCINKRDVLEGPSTMTCEQSGDEAAWSQFGRPICNAVKEKPVPRRGPTSCEKPSPPEHGTVMCGSQPVGDQYREGTVCQYFCFPGFTISSSDSRPVSAFTCRDGRWTAPDHVACKASHCRLPPKFSNGRVLCNGKETSLTDHVSLEAVCEYVCDENFVIPTSQLHLASVKCVAGEWNTTETPACQAAEAPRPTGGGCVNQTFVVQPGRSLDLGSRLPGFESWSGSTLRPTCSQQRRLPPGLHLNRCEVKDDQLRTTAACSYYVRVRERVAPKPYGSDCKNRTVFSDGGPVLLKPARFTLSRDEDEPKRVVGVCTHSGKALPPGQYLNKCSARDPEMGITGKCTYHVTVKEKSCPALKQLPRSRLYCFHKGKPLRSKSYPPLTECEYKCNEGYFLTKEYKQWTKRKCTASLRWDITKYPFCKSGRGFKLEDPKRDCQDIVLEVKSSSEVVDVSHPKYKSAVTNGVVNVQCTIDQPVGVGNHTNVCNATDLESGLTASCKYTVSVKVKTCPPLEKIEHGDVECTVDNASMSTICSYVCHEGYDAEGPLVAKLCSESGEWNSTDVPSCLEKLTTSTVLTNTTPILETTESTTYISTETTDNLSDITAETTESTTEVVTETISTLMSTKSTRTTDGTTDVTSGTTDSSTGSSSEATSDMTTEVTPGSTDYTSTSSTTSHQTSESEDTTVGSTTISYEITSNVPTDTSGTDETTQVSDTTTGSDTTNITFTDASESVETTPTSTATSYQTALSSETTQDTTASETTTGSAETTVQSTASGSSTDTSTSTTQVSTTSYETSGSDMTTPVSTTTSGSSTDTSTTQVSTTSYETTSGSDTTTDNSVTSGSSTDTSTSTTQVSTTSYETTSGSYSTPESTSSGSSTDNQDVTTGNYETSESDETTLGSTVTSGIFTDTSASTTQETTTSSYETSLLDNITMESTSTRDTSTVQDVTTTNYETSESDETTLDSTVTSDASTSSMQDSTTNGVSTDESAGTSGDSSTATNTDASTTDISQTSESMTTSNITTETATEFSTTAESVSIEHYCPHQYVQAWNNTYEIPALITSDLSNAEGITCFPAELNPFIEVQEVTCSAIDPVTNAVLSCQFNVSLIYSVRSSDVEVEDISAAVNPKLPRFVEKNCPPLMAPVNGNLSCDDGECDVICLEEHEFSDPNFLGGTVFCNKHTGRWYSTGGLLMTVPDCVRKILPTSIKVSIEFSSAIDSCESDLSELENSVQSMLHEWNKDDCIIDTVNCNKSFEFNCSENLRHNLMGLHTRWTFSVAFPERDYDNITEVPAAEEILKGILKRTRESLGEEKAKSRLEAIGLSLWPDTVSASRILFVCDDPGFVPDGNWDCVECPTGTMENDTICEPCSPGYYQDKTGQTKCLLCPTDETHPRCDG